MNSNASIHEYARLAYIFRQALDDASEEIRRFDAFRLYPKGCCGDCSRLLSRFIVEHDLPEPSYILGEKVDGSSHVWLEINNVIIDITHNQFGEPPAVYIGGYDAPHVYLDFRVKKRERIADEEYIDDNAYLENIYSIAKRHITS